MESNGLRLTYGRLQTTILGWPALLIMRSALWGLIAKTGLDNAGKPEMSRKRKKRRPGRQAPVPSQIPRVSSRTWSFWLFVIAVPVGVAAIAICVPGRFSPFRSGSAPTTGSALQNQSTTSATQNDADDVAADSGSGTSSANTARETAAAAKKTPAPEPSTSDAPLTDQQREQALRQEQIAAARELLRAFPTDSNAVYLSGLVYLEQGSSDEALVQFERCLQLNPTRPDLYSSMGQVHFLKGELDRAVEMFRKALALDPNFFDARLRLAETLNRQGKMAEVVAALEDILRPGSDSDLSIRQVNPERKEDRTDADTSTEASALERAYRLLGQAYQQLKDYDKAKQSFKTAVEISPDSTKAHYGLARICAILKQPDEAKLHQEKFRQLEAQKQVEGRDVRRSFDPLEVTRQNVAHTHTDVGRVYQRKGDLARAEQFWRRAAELDSNDGASRMYLAEMYHQAGKLTEALAYYEKLAKIEPTQGVHFFHIGNVNVLLKQLDAAEVAYRKSIELEPTRADGYRGLAQFYLVSQRNLPEAISLAREALALSPTAPVYALLGDLYDQTGDPEGRSGRCGGPRSWTRAMHATRIVMRRSCENTRISHRAAEDTKNARGRLSLGYRAGWHLHFSTDPAPAAACSLCR